MRVRLAPAAATSSRGGCCCLLLPQGFSILRRLLGGGCLLLLQVSSSPLRLEGCLLLQLLILQLQPRSELCFTLPRSDGFCSLFGNLFHQPGQLLPRFVCLLHPRSILSVQLFLNLHITQILFTQHRFVDPFLNMLTLPQEGLIKLSRKFFLRRLNNLPDLALYSLIMKITNCHRPPCAHDNAGGPREKRVGRRELAGRARHRRRPHLSAVHYYYVLMPKNGESAGCV